MKTAILLLNAILVFIISKYLMGVESLALHALGVAASTGFMIWLLEDLHESPTEPGEQ